MYTPLEDTRCDYCNKRHKIKDMKIIPDRDKYLTLHVCKSCQIIHSPKEIYPMNYTTKEKRKINRKS